MSKLDPLLNPFSPGAGTPPPELAGRKEIIDKSKIAMARVKEGRAEKSFFLVGLRGVGKTVLLNKIVSEAKDLGYKPIMIEAREDKKISQLLIPCVRQLLLQLDVGELVSDKVKLALRVLKSFALKVQPDGAFELGLDIEAERGVADSGDLESDFTQLFVSVGEAAKDKKTAVAILIDEVQYLSDMELSSLIMAVHKITQLSLPVIVMGAGLPQFLGKAGNAKSYAERLFDYPEVGQLEDKDAILALQQPVLKQDVSFSDEALQLILDVTEKYPYFLQEWGYQSWLVANSNSIDKNAVNAATEIALKRLDKNFFRVRYDRLTPREKKYLRAMAEFGQGSIRSGDIAKVFGTSVKSAAGTRESLIKKGMIYSPNYGDTSFSVPLFADFMKRMMPLE
jgi:hypothetical protein